MIGGGVLVIGGVITALVADRMYGDLEANCPDHVCPPERQGDIDALRATSITTDVLLGVGVAAAAAGFVWYLVAAKGGHDDSDPSLASRHGPSLRVVLDVSPTYVGMHGSF